MSHLRLVTTLPDPPFTSSLLVAPFLLPKLAFSRPHFHETVTHPPPLALQDLVLQQPSFSAIQSVVVTSGSTVAAAKTTQAHVPHIHKLKCSARGVVPTSPDMRHAETGPSGESGTRVSPFLSFVILSQLNNIYEIYVYRSVPRLVTVYSRELHCIQYPFSPYHNA